MYHVIEENCIGCGACKRVCPVDAISGEKKEIHIIDGKYCINCSSCGRVCPKNAVKGHGQVISKLKRDQWLKPHIDKEKCYACENCIAACPVDALSMAGENLPLTENYAVFSSPDLCVSCGWCFDNCQFDAIKMEVLSAGN
jgi:ferredoxin